MIFNGRNIHRFVWIRNVVITLVHIICTYLYVSHSRGSSIQFTPHHSKKWESDGQRKTINAQEVSRNRNNKIQANIEDLNPGTTYTVRLRVLSAVASEGESSVPGKPSPELIIDTEAVSCTPKSSQCLILWWGAALQTWWICRTKGLWFITKEWGVCVRIESWLWYEE